MKIYLDYNIADPLGFPPWPDLDSRLSEIPNDVDLIGLTFFHHDITKIQPIVDLALSKSRYVIIYFCEFNGYDVVKFEKEYHLKYPNLQIFANAVPHYHSRLKHIGEWFMQLNNPYSHESWAQDLLTKLLDYHDRLARFDCLLGKQGPARDFIAEKYYQCPRQQDFIFTYFKTDPTQGRWDELNDIDIPTMSGYRTRYQNVMVSASNILPVEIYNQSHYSIVSDTMCPPYFNFYTEKIAKPIIAKRLFVAFGAHRYLENLKRLGFQTFNNIIDESYDLIVDDHARWQAAWEQVEFLLDQDPAMIKKKCQSIVEYNQNLILSTDWAAPVRDHVQAIINQL